MTFAPDLRPDTKNVHRIKGRTSSVANLLTRRLFPLRQWWWRGRSLYSHIAHTGVGANEGERLALRYLLRQGLTLECANFRCRMGEIDLVMQDRRTTEPVLVFVEVRQRSSRDFGGAAASVTPAKQQRLRKTALTYLQSLKTIPPCRFDVVAIDGGCINWIPNAFDSI